MLKSHDVELTVCDVNHGKAEDIAFSLGAHFTTPEEIFESECDIMAPCAIGGVLTGPRAHKLKAWGVCGAAIGIAVRHTGRVLVFFIAGEVSTAHRLRGHPLCCT